LRLQSVELVGDAFQDRRRLVDDDKRGANCSGVQYGVSLSVAWCRALLGVEGLCLGDGMARRIAIASRWLAFGRQARV
jgi:hypothetical protein